MFSCNIIIRTNTNVYIMYDIAKLVYSKSVILKDIIEYNVIFLVYSKEHASLAIQCLRANW